MKYFETHFDDYLNANKTYNLHPEFEEFYNNNMPNNIADFKNLIFYGPSGVGKYTQALKCIKKYSPSELKYEKRINARFDDVNYCIKLSDIHCEIHMGLLGCNSKLIWHELFNKIVDIIIARPLRIGIIICRGFHNINSDLLDLFYSYMQTNVVHFVSIKFIILTEQISFIPSCIINTCHVLSVRRPRLEEYSNILNISRNRVILTNEVVDTSNTSAIVKPVSYTPIILPQNLDPKTIINIKDLLSVNTELAHPHKFICNKILEVIMNADRLRYKKFRDLLYDILTYNLNIAECVWYIFQNLNNAYTIHPDDLSKVMIKIYQFFYFFNNNYRPICHIENLMLFFICIIQNYPVQI